ncbi:MULTISPECIES: hypothetical protein [unclassified Kitasatospora]|uniref:hypothetical protein n=1 Tax=unclassified Kitasatospora TaxID=2633591 RepID=UPI0033E980E5
MTDRPWSVTWKNQEYHLMATNPITTAICAAGVLAGVIAAATAVRHACSSPTPATGGSNALSPGPTPTPDSGGGIGCQPGTCAKPPIPGA